MIQYIPLLGKLIDKLFPNPADAEKAKAEMMTIMADAQAKEMEAKSKVIVAEAQGESVAQRNWRPHLMYLFMFILAFNYIIAPLVGMLGVNIETLPIPSDMWLLLSIGVGGYIGGRSAEKISKAKSDKRWFDAIRSVFGHLSQEQVTTINNERSKD